MLVKTKKLIAKEFLIFISIIVLTILFWAGLLLYNLTVDYRNSKIDKEIYKESKVEDSLSYEFIRKQKEQRAFYTRLSKAISYPDEDSSSKSTWEALHDIYYENTVKSLWGNWEAYLPGINKLGFNNAKELSSYIGKNLISRTDSLNFNKYLELKSKRTPTNYFNKYSVDEQEKSVLIVFIILMCLAFPFRFLLKLIGWSIKTLRAK